MRRFVTGRSGVIVLAAVAAVGVAAYWFVQPGPGTFSYHERQAALAGQQRDFYQEHRHWKQCLELRPDDPPHRRAALHLRAARAARRYGNLAEAAGHVHQHDQLLGNQDDHAHEVLLMQLQQGDTTQAEALLAACADNPAAAPARQTLEAIIEGSLVAARPAYLLGTLPGGEANVHMERARRALDVWRQHSSGPADQAQGLIWRARIHNLVNDSHQAFAALHQALELRPESVEVRVALSERLAQTAPEEAMGHLEIALKSQPDNVRVSLPLARGRRGLGQLHGAKTLLDHILAVHPDHVPALVERGLVALDNQELDDAKQWLQRAQKLEPESQAVNLALSRCHHRAGDVAEARRYLDRAFPPKAKPKQP